RLCDGDRLAGDSALLRELMEAVRESFWQRDDGLAGTLRLAAPFGYGRQRIGELVARFANLHPQLCLHLALGETPRPDRDDSDAVI
ncbi:LysR family transcriptional regulator, partial [Pseudomonas syringae pv. tagetis]